MKKILLLSILSACCGYVSGQSFYWAKAIGGKSNEISRSIINDPAGNTYIFGIYSETCDFNPGTSVFNMTAVGSIDMFIAKLDGDGNFLWAKSIGGAGAEEAMRLSLDASGNLLATGYFNDKVDFDPGTGTFNLTSSGSDIFILKLNANGDFIWAIKAGGSSTDVGYSITADLKRNVYITGNYAKTADFDPGTSTANLTSLGSTDVFISKYDSMGNFVWAKSVGDSGIEWGNAIAVDSLGNIFVTGQFQFSVDFDPGSGKNIITKIGFSDVFILKLTTSGDFVWAKNIGGTAGGTLGTNAFAINVNRKGQVYISGTFLGLIDFDPGANKSELTAYGSKDIFILKLENNGNFVWARRFGNQYDEDVRSIITDRAGNIYTTGSFQTSLDFGSTILKTNGSLDIFVMAMDESGTFKWAQNFGGSTVDAGYASSVDNWGNVFTTGTFTGNVDFDPSSTVFGISSKGGSDAFIAKLSPQSAALKNLETEPFTIYPNPTAGLINVVSESTIDCIEILNTIGQIKLKIKPDAKNIVLELDQKGIYFIKILRGNAIYFQKVMVK